MLKGRLKAKYVETIEFLPLNMNTWYKVEFYEDNPLHKWVHIPEYGMVIDRRHLDIKVGDDNEDINKD